jgi:hypothetical protein
MKAASGRGLAARELVEQRAGVQGLDVLKHVLLAAVDRAQGWEVDPAWALPWSSRPRRRQRQRPSKEHQSLLVHIGQIGYVPAAAAWTRDVASGRTWLTSSLDWLVWCGMRLR